MIDAKKGWYNLFYRIPPQGDNMGVETLIIQGLASAFKSLVISEATDLVADQVKNAVKDHLDEDQQKLLTAIIEKTSSRL